MIVLGPFNLFALLQVTPLMIDFLICAAFEETYSN
jgi:hypothetical protein